MGMEGWAKVSGCFWMIGLCVMGLNWVTLFGDEPSPCHELARLFQAADIAGSFFHARLLGSLC